jgi:hypothetical protein
MPLNEANLHFVDGNLVMAIQEPPNEMNSVNGIVHLLSVA